MMAFSIAALGCSVLLYVVLCPSVLQCVTACCSVSQCVAVCCSVLQCIAVHGHRLRTLIKIFNIAHTCSTHNSCTCVTRSIHTRDMTIHPCDMTQFTYVTRLMQPYNNCSLTYRVAKTHRIPYLYRSFSAKVTYM